MTTLYITLPDELQSFVDQQVTENGFETCNEYIRGLISKERDRQHLRDLIMEGVDSPMSVVADDEFFDEILARIDQAEHQWYASRSS